MGNSERVVASLPPIQKEFLIHEARRQSVSESTIVRQALAAMMQQRARMEALERAIAENGQLS